jgi:hypothetical protein
MADETSTADREQRRRWIANWRVVNDAQDELARSAAAPDPAASLARGLSLIEFARRVRARDGDTRRDRDVESVRRTWRRLRAAYVR